MAYELPALPYAYDALEPHIDARTMEIHHTKHHQAYITNVNKVIAGTEWEKLAVEDLVAAIHRVPEQIRTVVRNHGGGHANHSLFWTVIGPNGGGEPKGKLAQAIERELGGFEKFRAAFTAAAMGRFGSGWAWLSVDPNKRLVIEDTPNQNSPLMHGHIPILGIDVWEHAYYLKYQNRRNEYVEAFYHVINWGEVLRRYEAALAQPVPESAKHPLKTDT
ncbi:MAG: superoxide dismutase [Thermogutta sp.]|nr:superoxide dismutase [Thermogutta sp.]HPU07671.1 superoxide dismutase [Thermogutta sp.]HPZ82726.1 superoxide dismutase [Thermogutta sp.]HQF13018.1 superoxide dismutase [Thermogutta sp.]